MTNYGTPKLSMNPTPSPMSAFAPKGKESWIDWLKRQALETAGEGASKLGSDLYSGAKNFGSGMLESTQGIAQGLGDIATHGYASQDSADKLYGGGQKAIGGFLKAGFSPFSAGVATLPDAAQGPVERGITGIGDALSSGVDLIPQAIGGATSIIGKKAYLPNLEQIGSRISKSKDSKSWKEVNKNLQSIIALSLLLDMPGVPQQLSTTATAPMSAATKYIGQPVSQMINKIASSIKK